MMDEISPLHQPCPHCGRPMHLNAAGYHCAFTGDGHHPVVHVWTTNNTATDQYKAGAEAMREAAAMVALNGCLVPPDGGAPTAEEAEMCASIAQQIRSIPVPGRK